MTASDLNTLAELEDEMQFLQAKLAALDQKKLALFEAEEAIRTDMQHVQNQIERLKQIQKSTN